MRTIYTRKGEEILVDDVDYEQLNKFTWSIGVRSAVRSVRVKKNGKWSSDAIYMHRQIMGLAKGDVLTVDHINHNTRDNRRSNLRVCPQGQNAKNKLAYKTNTSGFKGVIWYKKYGKWMAQIQSDNKHKNLGYFLTREEAHAAYCEAAKVLHGEFANPGL